MALCYIQVNESYKLIKSEYIFSLMISEYIQPTRNPLHRKCITNDY
jgi:hypothetical protein